MQITRVTYVGTYPPQRQYMLVLDAVLKNGGVGKQHISIFEYIDGQDVQIVPTSKATPFKTYCPALSS